LASRVENPESITQAARELADGSPPTVRSGASRGALLRVADRLPRHREAGIVAAGVILFCFFWVLSGGAFVTAGNWAAILSNAAELGIITVGVAMLMVGGDFDLSVGANFGLSGLVMAKMVVNGTPISLALLAVLGLGAGIGLMNGLVTVVLDIPSFAATLGSWLIWSGITLIVAGGATITVFDSGGVLTALGGTAFNQFSWESGWWLLVAVLAAVTLHRTPFGNWVYAVGGKSSVAREAGVAVARTRIANFTVCGLLAAFAGAVTLGHLSSMSASYGSDYQLQAIAASVVGGCALYGGQGSIFGAVVGSVILSMLGSGLILIGVSPYWYETLVGVIVILAVAMHHRVGRLIAASRRAQTS
jgi:simple sugar transport system permease protein